MSTNEILELKEQLSSALAACAEKDVALRKVQWARDHDCMHEAYNCVGCGTASEYEGREGNNHEGCPIAEALAGQPAAKGEEKWRPIATAPKDGTCVVLADERHRSVGRYDDTPNIGNYGPWRWGITTQPTHWLPLPAAPAEQPAVEGVGA